MIIINEFSQTEKKMYTTWERKLLDFLMSSRQIWGSTSEQQKMKRRKNDNNTDGAYIVWMNMPIVFCAYKLYITITICSFIIRNNEILHSTHTHSAFFSYVIINYFPNNYANNFIV